MLGVYLSDFFSYGTAWLCVFACLTVWEVLNPREDHRLASRLHGLGFWIISIALGLILTKAWRTAWDLTGWRPLFELPPISRIFPNEGAAVLIAGILSALVHDFFFYWYHRAQHRWLWKWHSVHHSVTELNAVNSYHHISESIFSLMLISIPMTLLIADIGPSAPIMTFALWCHIVWIHSPTRATLGPLRVVLCDNRFHRIHHSLEERHFDKNFGAFTTLWDRVFGTMYMPARDEWPAVGLAEVSQPASFKEWLDMPARIAPPGPDGDLALDPAKT